MAPPFAVLAVDHVHVTTPADLEEEVVAWYRDTLGLEQVEKPDGTRPEGAWFKAGAQEVHVSVDEQNPPKVSHFGIVVSDFDAAVDGLRAAGCHIEQARTIPGRHRFYTRDPAGNRIEVVHFDAQEAVVAYEEGSTTVETHATVVAEEAPEEKPAEEERPYEAPRAWAEDEYPEGN